MPAPDGFLRVALLTYRGNPHSGGQGVYTRHLSRELTALGHRVEVFSGQPYPELDPDVPLVAVPSLDLYRPDNPFRLPRPSEFRDRIDVAEIGGKHRQMPLNIHTGTVEALKGPNGKCVPKIMDSWTALPNRASQTGPASQLPERMLDVRKAQPCAELRNKEAVVFGLREDSTA